MISFNPRGIFRDYVFVFIFIDGKTCEIRVAQKCEFLNSEGDSKARNRESI